MVFEGSEVALQGVTSYFFEAMMEFAMQDLWWIFALFAAIVFLKITTQFLCYLKYKLIRSLEAGLKTLGEMERREMRREWRSGMEIERRYGAR